MVYTAPFRKIMNTTTDIVINRAFLGGLGTTELVIILIIVLILFGAGKLPHVGTALGKAFSNFRKSVSSSEDSKDSSQENND